MMNNYDEILNNYKKLNEKAIKGSSVVLFGADWLSKVPISEISRDSGMDTVIYNRSIKGLSLKDSEKVAEICITQLNPSKVFINLGENDMTEAGFVKEEFAEKFEWLLYVIHSCCNCDIYILSIVNDIKGEANDILQNISQKYGCEYIDIRECKTSFINFFNKIRFFLRTHPITFCEAMNI